MADRSSLAGSANHAEVKAYLDAHRQDDLVPGTVQQELARRFGLSAAEAEAAILECGLLPARYTRNRHMLSTAQQRQLFASSVGVLGCGGIGGFVVEELARLGVGHLTAVDPDAFEEHNLNRQLLASPATLGRNKAAAAADRVASINPAVTVRAVEGSFSEATANSLLGGLHVVVDALDSVDTRLTLAASCGALQIPLVHGAIAGWYGYVTTVFPGDVTLKHLYGRGTGPRGIEAKLGNPSFTPAVVASLQVAEVCKILLGLGTPMRNRILSVNLLDLEIEIVPVQQS